VRLDSRIQTLKKGREFDRVKFKVKNKVAPPFRIAEFDYFFVKGVSSLGCVVDLAETALCPQRSLLQGDNISQGRTMLSKYLEDNPEVAKTSSRCVKAGNGTVVSANSVMVSEEAEEMDVEGRITAN